MIKSLMPRVTIVVTLLGGLSGCTVWEEIIGKDKPPQPVASPTSQPGPSIPPAVEQPNPALQGRGWKNVQKIASLLYDAVERGDDISTSLGEIFQSLGISFLRLASQQSEIKSAQQANDAIVLDVQLKLLNSAFHMGHLVKLDSFFTAFAQAGVTATAVGESFTKAYMTEKLASLVGKEPIADEELLPALVLALGNERAKRYGLSATDPVWGDAFLDPLQYTLLLYGVLFSAEDDAVNTGLINVPTASVSRSSKKHPYLRLAQFTPTEIREYLGNKLVRKMFKKQLRKIIRAPISTLQASREAICSSILLYGHKVELHAAPNQVWRHQPEKPDLPYISILTATLTFDFVPDKPGEELRNQLLFLLRTAAGCGDLPPAGSVKQKTITWEIVHPPSPSIEQHGFIHPKTSNTGIGGRAETQFQTKKEVASLKLPSNLRQQDGEVSATVIGILPDLETVELVVRELRKHPAFEGPPGVATVGLRVKYYQPAEYSFELDLREEAPQGNGQRRVDTERGTIPLRYDEDKKAYTGTGTVEMNKYITPGSEQLSCSIEMTPPTSHPFDVTVKITEPSSASGNPSIEATASALPDGGFIQRCAVGPLNVIETNFPLSDTEQSVTMTDWQYVGEEDIVAIIRIPDNGGEIRLRKAKVASP